MRMYDETKRERPATIGAAITAALIEPGVEVRSSNDLAIGIVARMSSPVTLKLRQDLSGMYHYIPLAWVRKVDRAVHVDRTAEQARREWAIVPPKR
jgi:hypothetical protein